MGSGLGGSAAEANAFEPLEGEEGEVGVVGAVGVVGEFLMSVGLKVIAGEGSVAGVETELLIHLVAVEGNQRVAGARPSFAVVEGTLVVRGVILQEE